MNRKKTTRPDGTCSHGDKVSTGENHIVAEEFIAACEHVVVIGRIQGKTHKAAVLVDVSFFHVWAVREGYLQRLRAFTDTALLAQALAKD